MIEMVAQFFLEVIGFYTAKWLLPFLSFSRLRVWEAAEKSFTRLPDGSVGIHVDLAGAIGLAIWVVIIAGGILIYQMSA